MRQRTWVLVALLVLNSSALGAGVTIKSSGKLDAPAKNVPLLVVSTDPVLQRVLSEDITAAGRTTITSAKRAATLTVTSSERTLTPGLSVQQLAPGDPEVGKLLAEAGVNAPALGVGTGGSDSSNAAAGPSSPTTPFDPQQQQAARYESSMMPMLSGMGMPSQTNSATNAPTGGSNGSLAGGLASLLGQHNDESAIYDTVLVVKAELDEGGKMTLLAIVPPGQNLSAVKETLAEKIANALLR